MFKPKSNVQKRDLQTVIDDLIAEMAGYDAKDEEFAKCAVQLDRLYKLKQIDKPERVKPDTLVIVAGNILVTVVIVMFERDNIVTTKALSFLTKTR